MNVFYKKILYIVMFMSLFSSLKAGTMSNNDTKFDWKATESGPKKYPMQIINGMFYYHGEDNNGLYVPNGATLYEGWGSMRSSHNVGPDLKPLPDRLSITYFSFVENKFYQGDFDLPYEKILSLFRQGVEANKDDPTYQRIMVGVAPGGAVAVWLFGNGVKEVFFGKAEAADIDWEKAIGIPPEMREEAVRMTIDESVGLPVLTEIEKNGIPFQQWEEFRTQYNWLPTFAVSHPPKNFGMTFYNGETGRFNFPLEEEFIKSTHPVPDGIRFHYAVNGLGIQYLYVINFDQAEMFDVYSQLGADQQFLQLEFHPKVPIERTQVILHSEKESVTLKKFTIEKID